MEKKICSKCKIEKDVCEFHKMKLSKDGYQYKCIECKRKYSFLNRENENKRKLKWKENNYEKIIQSKKKYYANNKIKEQYRNNNYKTKKIQTDPLFKLTCVIRSRVIDFLKSNKITKNNKTFEIVGCAPSELKTYLEDKFIENMTWENHGEWHIDHIVPLSSGKSEEEILKLCHYSNLQPLWAKDNLKKGKKLI